MALLVAALLLAAPARAAEGPSNLAAPVLSGSAQDGKTLKSSRGSWSPEKGNSYTYAWGRCDAQGQNCVAVESQSSAKYKLTAADVGDTLRSTVTAIASGQSSSTSAPTSIVAAAAPRKGRAAKITGNLEDGQLLSVGTGTWKGTAPFAYSYQWEFCPHGSACSTIPGASGASYRATTSQIGGKFRVLITAENEAGSASRSSHASKALKPGAPIDITPPTISGSYIDGQTLTAQPGTWGGTGPISYSYQWERCALLGGGCETIAGATEPTYALSAQDLASKLVVLVTATGADGIGTAASAETLSVSALLPENVVPPAIGGLLQDGGLAELITGTWTGTAPIAYSYEWKICSATGEACKTISEASGPTLALLSSYIGGTLEAVVTATNEAGSTSVTTPLTSLISGFVPVNTVLPAITGLLQDGQLLNVGTGSWTGSQPIAYGYQWQLCNALGKACSGVEGATGSSFSLSPEDIGKTLAVVVTATNPAGSSSVTTSVSALIEGILPKNTALPAITGSLVDGQLLKTGTGSWTGSAPIAFSYQWQLCNAAGGACVNVAEALSSALTLSPADVGSTLRMVVTASNAAGTTTATSAPTGLIGALLPSNTILPSISGLLKSGQTLKALNGTWTGTPTITYGYQWQLCNVLGSGCANIAKATGPTFLLSLLDIGLPVRVLVTATNAAGSTSATSAVTGLIEGLGL